MLSPQVAAEIRSRLADGQISQRALARELGVSRGTIGVIATGKRPQRPSKTDESLLFGVGDRHRCDGCGATVRGTCLACYLRSLPSRPRRAG